jgi:hypothetical protein
MLLWLIVQNLPMSWRPNRAFHEQDCGMCIIQKNSEPPASPLYGPYRKDVAWPNTAQRFANLSPTFRRPSIKLRSSSLEREEHEEFMAQLRESCRPHTSPGVLCGL